MNGLLSVLDKIVTSVKRRFYGNVALAIRFYVEKASVIDGKLTIASESNQENESVVIFYIDKVVEVYFFPSKTMSKEGDLDVVFAMKNDRGGLVSHYAGTINILGTSEDLLATMLGSLSDKTNFGDFPKEQLENLRLHYAVMRAKKLNII